MASEVAGFSKREIDTIIKTAPYRFNSRRWAAVKATREQEVEWYCSKWGMDRPEGPRDWEIYRLGRYSAAYRNGSGRIRKEWFRANNTEKYLAGQRVDSWKEAAKRVDAQKGHLTIFDIFYDVVVE